MSLFPADIIAAAQKSQRDTGCPACITLAQWAEESGYGHAVSGTHNYFGIKWAKGCPYTFTMCWTQEEVNGKRISIKAPFINFPDAATGFDYHGKLLMNPNGPYKRAIPFKNNWRVFLHQIVVAPYATDSQYEHNITKIIVDNHLDYYNKV